MPRRIDTYIYPDGSIKIETHDFPGNECEKAKQLMYAHLQKDGLQLQEVEKIAKPDGIKVKVDPSQIKNTLHN